MTKKLVIVESPAKSKTIEKFLGSDYKVLSSKGHIRDLATKGKFGLGIELENNYKPIYINAKGKKALIDELKKEAKKVDEVLIATDHDREGEAIGWHLYDVMGLNENNSKRVVFNEITKSAVVDAISHARNIDMNLVNSQEARRLLDRIIGFRLSKLMQAKTSGTSAGRVQSVALKLIVEREKEINAFIPEEYWTISADFNDFKADLFNYNHKELKINNETEAKEILSKLSNSFKIDEIKETTKNKSSKLPFTTSTFQQDASTKLNFNAKKSMMIAQKLYEGIDIGNETVGLISYMRTDSTRLSNEFITETFKHIENNYGSEYVGVVKKQKTKENVQDAHEAIRPTSISRTPLSLKPYLTSDEYKIYKIIYTRALASLMAPAKTNNTTVIFDNNNYQFKVTGQTIIFDGYLKVYSEYEDTKETILPPFKTYKSNVIVSSNIESAQHFTKPKARYSESELIKEMEELGIGRPSTYSKTMETLKERGYVNIIEKRFHPTEIGFEITEKLSATFEHIINVEYTAAMENDLDKIAEGDAIWYEVIDNFYKEFEPALKEAFDKLEKKEPEKVGRDCPNCGSPLVLRKGKYGEFVGCSNYPACKYIETEEKKQEEVADCSCGGKIVAKKTKRGKIFYGCNNYPTCKNAYWDKPTGELCPKCSKMLVEKNKKIKCSECDYEK